MEMFIHIALFLLGLFLIWNGINSLKKLKENNQQLAEIERKYYLYKNGNQSVIKMKTNDIKTTENIKDKQQMVNAMRDDILLYNKYQNNYEEAEKIVNKLKKIIPFFAKFSLFDGLCCILFSFYSIFTDYQINTYYFIYIPIVLLFVSSFIFVNGFFGDLHFPHGTLIGFNCRYELLTEYFNNKDYLTINKIKKLFEYYLIQKKWCSTKYYEDENENYLTNRIVAFCFFYIGIFLFSFVLSFDIN